MAAAAAISIFNSFAYGISGSTFVFGPVSCIGGLVCLVLAAIIGLFRDLKNGKGDKELAKAFLMAAGKDLGPGHLEQFNQHKTPLSMGTLGGLKRSNPQCALENGDGGVPLPCSMHTIS